MQRSKEENYIRDREKKEKVRERFRVCVEAAESVNKGSECRPVGVLDVEGV